MPRKVSKQGWLGWLAAGRQHGVLNECLWLISSAVVRCRLLSSGWNVPPGMCHHARHAVNGGQVNDLPGAYSPFAWVAWVAWMCLENHTGDRCLAKPYGTWGLLVCTTLGGEERAKTTAKDDREDLRRVRRLRCEPVWHENPPQAQVAAGGTGWHWLASRKCSQVG